MSIIMVDKINMQSPHTMNNFHSHSHYELYILTKGQRIMFLHNKLYTLNAPTCFIIPPFTMHKTEGGKYERYNINVFGKYLDQTEREFLTVNALLPIMLSDGNFKTMVRLLEILSEFCSKEDSYNDYMARANFNSILSLIGLSSKSDPHIDNSATKLPMLILRILDFYNAHYAEKITLDSLAEEFFVSKTTIIYNFNKYLKISPIEHLLNVRLAKAKDLLLMPKKKSIESIAEACGFSSAHYFTEYFRNREGIPPSEFRKFYFREVHGSPS